MHGLRHCAGGKVKPESSEQEGTGTILLKVWFIHGIVKEGALDKLAGM